MTVSDVFTHDCSGTVFDLPCPTSFVGDNRVVGNLVVQADAVFGGGHVTASGPAANGATFELVLDDDHFSVVSGGNADIAAGNSRALNARGGQVDITAGDGTNLQGGSGGKLRGAPSAGRQSKIWHRR